MFEFKFTSFLCGTVMILRLSSGAVTDLADDFDSNTGTYPGWVSVGSVATTVEYDSVSEADYDDGDPSTNLAYTAGMLITGEGVKDDGGLRFNTQNSTQGDEAVGLTVGGTLEPGEELIFSGNVYNDGSSFSRYKAQLWNLTDNTLLAESAGTLVRGKTHIAYVPEDFNVAYTALVSDAGDTLQLRFLEDNDNAVRDIYVDHFSLDSSLSTAPTYSIPSTNKFWFSFYSTINDDSAYSVSNGATGIGPYYGGTSGQVSPLAEAATLDANFSYKVNLPSMAGFTAANSDAFLWPPDATLIAEATAVVDAVKTNRNIIIWDLVPEELRHWKPNEMNYVEVVADAIRAADPLGRPVMMYEPNNRKMTSLIHTIPHLDICSKGTYVTAVNGGEFRHNRIWARWSMEQQLGAIAAANTNAVPWVMLHMAYDVPDGEEHWIEDWCRHDAYMGLIMGGQGISVWSGWRPRNSWTNDFQDFFDGYLSVAADLNHSRNLAPVFLFGTETAGVTHSVSSGPSSLELIYGGETNSYPPVTYRMREFLGQQYLFMVNSATQAVSLTFSGVPDAARTDLFTGTHYGASGGTFAITLDPYEVAGFRFDGYEIWRAIHFPVGGADGENDDPDGDGRTNREEFNAGTDPNLGTDFFQSGLMVSNDWKTVFFNTQSNRYYQVDRSTNLVAGNWFPMLGNELGLGLDMSVTDTNDYSDAFYRTRATRP
ncbi:alpha-glucosidase C-terminal domain-containing protein [Pontiellaceae bacterium B12227]|nr:alpha-glucosidase C-terminal domain-containing protein [Pontiellaceae bacterium B12227]